MKFYYENGFEDEGYFFETNLIKAIYTAWNIDASLWIINKDKSDKLIFSPLDDNELNSELLKEYGYYMIDGKEEREIREIKTNKIIKYDWDEVPQLI